MGVIGVCEAFNWKGAQYSRGFGSVNRELGAGRNSLKKQRAGRRQTRLFEADDELGAVAAPIDGNDE
jgi:hypothetical protein